MSEVFERIDARVDVPAFIRSLSFDQLPVDVVEQAKRCLLDLIGVATAGRKTRCADIMTAYVTSQMRGGDCETRVLFDGRKAGIAGAALAGATTIDALDAHDGHVLTKGHAGVAILPALLALVDGGLAPRAHDGREFLTCLVLGYEIATRAGIALHATTTDYHCSGAWNALACAAIAARAMNFDREQARHALGIAEYFGPRGQILRVCDKPTMLKDGSGWGAHAGISAALLARDDFTGAPALTVEHDNALPVWGDLGTRWRIREQYFKAYPVCRWAQPAIEAALSLQRAYDFAAEDIATIAIETFAEAVALGAGSPLPRTTDEAQYSLPFPVAAALVFGRVGADEVNGSALSDQRVMRLLGAMRLTEDADFSRKFPAERWARVRVTLADGRTLTSDPARARGNPENPLSDRELRAKYRALAEPVLGVERAEGIERLVDTLTNDRETVSKLIKQVLSDIVQP